VTPVDMDLKPTLQKETSLLELAPKDSKMLKNHK
jgi:hypothetical protein